MEEDNQRIGHQSHKQHTANDDRQKATVFQQRADAGICQGIGNQPEDSQGRKPDNGPDNAGNCIGQVVHHLPGGVTALAQH